MANGKWIDDLSATTPLADAARHVLTVRLEVVRDHLPKAIEEWEQDPEYVHQLRVGTRRARAALDIFAACMPEKVHTAARKRLRSIRRGAGEARDWDVFLASLISLGQAPRKRRIARSKSGPRNRKTTSAESRISDLGFRISARHRPGLDFLLGCALAQRLLAQTHLHEAAEDFPFTFEQFIADTVASVARPYHQHLRTLADLARPTLAELLSTLHQAATQDLDDYEHLHQVRILGKRLRYAMEVFTDCFPPTFRTVLYAEIEAMQEVLGNANDSHVASGRLTLLADKVRKLARKEARRLRPGLDGLRRLHQDRLKHERQRFVEWWERWQHSGHAATFAALLQASDTIAPGALAEPRT